MTKWLLSLSWKVSSVCIKMLNIKTMCSRIFGGKKTKAYCSLWAGVVSFCFCSLFSLLTGDVASAMKWRRLREKPSSPPVTDNASKLARQCRPDRMWSLDKPPASLALLPSRASSRTRSNPAVLTPQCWYEAIWVWSYTTFIVKLGFET